MGWERRLKEPFRERSQKHSKPGDVQLIIFDLTHVGLITPKWKGILLIRNHILLLSG